MTDDSSTFTPRHLRGRRVGPPACQWHLIDNPGLTALRRESFLEPRYCDNPIDVNSGVRLCKEHIRRIGYISGMVAPHHVRRMAREASEAEIERLNAEITRLKRTRDWQAKKLRGEVEQKPKRERPTVGVIYFLRSSGLIKIGWTSNLERRMREYPPDTTLLAVIPDATRKDENRLHRKFAHLRSHGAEWYPLAPQILDEAETAVAQHGPPPTVDFAAKAKRRIKFVPPPSPSDMRGAYPHGVRPNRDTA